MLGSSEGGFDPGRPPPTQRVPRWRIGERPSDMGVRGGRRMPPWTNWRLLQQGVVGWTGGAVASIKYHKNPTTKWTRRDKAPQNLYPCCSAGSPPPTRRKSSYFRKWHLEEKLPSCRKQRQTTASIMPRNQ